MTVQETLDAANGLGTTYGFDATNLFHGELSSNYDEDWIRAALEANYGYVVRLTGDGSATSISDSYLYLRTANGDGITYDDNSSSSTAIVSTTTTSAGTYYAQVGDDNRSYNGEAGSYNVELIREIATGLGTRETLEVDEVQNSTIEYDNDEDWFRLELEANYGYVVRLTGDGSATSISDSYLYLRTANGDGITYDDNSSSSTAIVSTTTTSAGTYYAQVGDDSYNYNGRAGSYNVELIREIASGLGTRESLTLGETESSAIEHWTDSDWFAVELVAGESYTFRLTSDGTANGITEATLGVHSTNGDSLTYSNSSTPSATIYYQATYSGVHYLRSGSEGSSYNGSPGNYEISAFADVPGTYDGAIVGGFGEFYEGRVSYEDDLDSFSFDLRSGQTYDVFLTGAGLEDGISTARVEHWDGGRSAESIFSSRSDTLISEVTTSYSDEYNFFVGNSDGNDRGVGNYHFAVLQSWSGDTGRNVLRGSNVSESIHGLGGKDRLVGRGGDDVLSGEGGKDRLFGGGGADYLLGGSRNDKLSGGKGSDVLIGGTGDDRLVGGGGFDVFVFANRNGNDTVVDFNARNRNEKIDLSGVSAIDSFSDLMNNHVSEDDGDVIITVGRRHSITLQNIDISQLDTGDFIF